MVDIAKLKVGQKVHYIGHKGAVPENGIVKSVPEDSVENVFVVYNCAGEWDKYERYTAQLTPIRELYLGWNHE